MTFHLLPKFLTIATILISNFALAAGGEKKEPVGGEVFEEAKAISTWDIIDYIEEHRPFLRVGAKINIVEAFIEKSNVVNFRFGNLKKVLNLSSMSFNGANLEDVTLSLASMRHISLQGASLRGADLVHVDLTEANLMGADFTNADLAHANLTQANILGAKFDGANLFNANFYATSGVTLEEREKLQKRSKIYQKLDREELEGYLDNPKDE